RRSSAYSAPAVLVAAAPPDAALVASARRAVEPLVHAPEAVQSACIGGIGVVDDAVLERERGHARPLARVRPGVGSASGCHLGDGPLSATLRTRAPLARLPPLERAVGGRDRPAPVVVFDASLALLLLGDPDVEVEVEVARERRGPREAPAHPPLVRLQLCEGRARHGT